MKLFILAAGKGTRLWPLTKNTPKSLLDLGDGTTLLERQIVGAIESGLFNEIVIITGYKAEQIDAKIKDYKKGYKITTIYNPFYETTNNFISLWAANYKMPEDDFMITNGDNVYNNGTYNKISNSLSEIIQLTISYKDKYDEDDMKVVIDSSNNIIKVNKEVPLEEVSAESVGLALIKGKKSRKIFINKLLQLTKEKTYHDKFWLEIFNSLIDDGVSIKYVEIARNQWKEVDFHPDVNLIKEWLL